MTMITQQEKCGDHLTLQDCTLSKRRVITHHGWCRNLSADASVKTPGFKKFEAMFINNSIENR